MKTLAIACGAALALLSTGCMTRNLRTVKDVPNSNTTLIETMDVMNAFFWVQVTHVFWQCNESGLTLTCERACDGTNNDLKCPMGAAGLAVSSNVR